MITTCSSGERTDATPHRDRGCRQNLRRDACGKLTRFPRTNHRRDHANSLVLPECRSPVPSPHRATRQVFHDSTKIARVDVVNAIKSRHQRS